MLDVLLRLGLHQDPPAAASFPALCLAPQDRERAAEAAFFNAEEERLLRNLLRKNEQAKTVSSAAAATPAAAAAPKKSKEEEALDKILPAATPEIKAKLIAWRHETF